MKMILTVLIAMTFVGTIQQNASAQQVDYIGYVERLAAQAGQRAQQHARRAIQLYRQQSGDYQSSDQAVYNYLVKMSRQQNPGWYNNLKQREAAFQQQQSAYRNYANSMLDSSFNSYMQRSNQQYQSHRRYVREGIWGQQYYTCPNTGQTYQLPNYAGGNVYRSQDGSIFVQDQSGNYYRYDQNGWRSAMNYNR